MTFLTKAALIEKVVRGTYRITPAGHELMTRFPDAIRIADLQAIPGFEDSWGKRAANTSGATGSLEGIVPLAALTSTPEDRIDQALRQLDDVLREELLEAILAKPPRFFEELVLDTLKSHGVRQYWRPRPAAHGR